MWQGGHHNPCEMQDCWECTFLKHYPHVKTKWALKRFFIIALFLIAILRFLPYKPEPELKNLRGKITKGSAFEKLVYNKIFLFTRHCTVLNFSHECDSFVCQKSQI